MNELIGARAFIYQTLVADPTLQGLIGARVFASFAPDVDPATGRAPDYPYIVFSLSASSLVLGAEASRLASRPLYLVKAVGENSGGGALQPIADRIDALLTTTEPVSVTAGNLTCQVRSNAERHVDYDEAPDQRGVRYSHLGGLYRLFISTDGPA